MLECMAPGRHEELHFRNDPDSGLQAVIAIHSTRLGPALGGCRCIEYPDSDAAIQDALRLSKGMSYKAALAGVPYGGGKAVIRRPHTIKDREALFRAFGEFVESLGGRYITAVDSGTSTLDMAVAATRTTSVTSTSEDADPSPWTALGVFRGIQSAVRHKLDREDLKGLRVAVQGVGHVGYPLARYLHEAGAELIVSEVDRNKARRARREFGAELVADNDIYAVDCDVFAPCGLGAVINDATLKEFRCSIIAGSANNQLMNEEHGVRLHEQGILYAPDFMINAGGLVFVALNHAGSLSRQVKTKVEQIEQTLDSLFSRAEAASAPTSEIASHMAEEIIYG